MPVSDIPCEIQRRIDALSLRKPRLQWLVEQNVCAGKIANFGCCNGDETLSLMWVLGASEAVGMDIKSKEIDDARRDLDSLQGYIRQFWDGLQYRPGYVPEGDRLWWDTVPDFFKRDLVGDNFCAKFIRQDITVPTGLPDDHYDVAFCDFVLNHIWSDRERMHPQEDTLFAICEMARVVVPDGSVAVFEPIKWSDTPRMDLRSLFRECGLEIVYEDEIEFVDSQVGPGVQAKYLCKKPTAESVRTVP